MKSALGRYTDGQQISGKLIVFSSFCIVAAAKRPFVSPHRQAPSHSKKNSDIPQLLGESSKRILEKVKPIAHLWKECTHYLLINSSSQENVKCVPEQA